MAGQAVLQLPSLCYLGFKGQHQQIKWIDRSVSGMI